MCFSPRKPTQGIDNLSRIVSMPPARKSDLIATLLGTDEFNEFASRFRLAVTAWRYANALAQALHWPAAFFGVFAQAALPKEQSVDSIWPYSLERLHESSGEKRFMKIVSIYLNNDVSGLELTL